MPYITKQKRCTITPLQAFDIVKDFRQYPSFLPWCSASRLQSVTQIDANTEQFIADLVIKYTLFTEVFTTKVICHNDTFNIDITYLKGPFKKLNSYWRFKPVDGNNTQTDVEFMIDFEMKFSPLQKVISLFFEEAMNKMINAFDDRFQALR
jgi:coenzyme Q-binding protein COQ10